MVPNVIALRVVKPGGRLIVSEYHKSRTWPMLFFGRTYFAVFEPFAPDTWGRFNSVQIIRGDQQNAWKIEQEACFFDNFQVLSATKGAKP